MRVSRLHLCSMLALATVGSAWGASAAPAAEGKYYVFRTLDSSNPPTTDQNARCDAHFGARSAAAQVRLNALLFSFRTDLTTSRLADQTARTLGPGFICGVPVTGRDDPFEAYAYTTLPRAGEGESTGTCGVQPIAAQPGALFFTCKLGLEASEATGVHGGLVTSNSIVNPSNAVPGTPTGSVWTAYIVQDEDARPQTPPPPPAGNAGSDVGGVDFYVSRASGDASPASSPACDNQPEAIRTASLRSAQPDLDSGALSDEAPSRTVGDIVVCYEAVAGANRNATAQIRLGDPAKPLVLSAEGQCRELAAVESADVRAQSCALTVEPGSGVRSGIVTSNGLVPAGKPAGASNSAVWTISLFGGAVEAVPPPRTQLRVKARTRVRGFSARWSASDPAAAFDVQIARAGSRSWQALRSATRGRSMHGRVKTSGVFKLRARATGGGWVVARVRVR